MARFRYLGESHHGDGFSGFECREINFHLSDGNWLTLSPPKGQTFKPGKDIGIDIIDERVLRHLRVDPRFEEI